MDENHLAHCLPCLDDNRENADEYVCVHSWSRQLNLYKTPVTVLFCLSVPSLVHVHPSDAFVLECCRQDNLNTPVLSFPLLCKRFFFISPCPPALSSDWLRHFTQTVGHSPCAKGKCGWKGGGHASCTVPHQASWGECRPFTRGLSQLSTICSLPLKQWSLSTKWDFPLTTQCWPWLFGPLKYNSWIIFSELGLVFIHWKVTHLLFKDKYIQK